MLIRLEDIRVGDEIIIARHSGLKYLKVLRLPIKSGSHTFKCSVGDWADLNNSSGFGGTLCQADISKHTNIIYQNLYWRDIWLVKRENNG